MKALSVRQPWASKIASGEKSLEIRTWSTKYRGPLLICVSASPKIDGLPHGVALCVVDVLDCRRVTADDAAAACCDVDPLAEFAFVLANPRPLEVTPAIKGRLGFFDVDLDSITASSLAKVG